MAIPFTVAPLATDWRSRTRQALLRQFRELSQELLVKRRLPAFYFRNTARARGVSDATFRALSVAKWTRQRPPFLPGKSARSWTWSC